MRVSHILLTALVATLPLAGVASPEHPARTLLAISKANHTLSVLDPDTLKVIARLPVGPDPHEVVASADGTRAYVSNTGYGLFHEINVLDLEHLKALPSVDTSPLLGPHGLAYVQDKLWFTAQGSQSVARYDPEAGKVDWVMGTGQNTTHMLYVRPDAKALYTTNVDSGTVSLLREVMVEPTMPPTGVLPAGAKPHLDWRQTTVKVGRGAEGFDVSGDGRQLWTASPEGVLSVVDLDTDKVRQQDVHMTGAHRLGISPDGKYVIVASVGTGELLVLDAKTQQEVKRLKTGRGAALLMDSVGNRAFISCTPDNKIVIFDFKTLEVATEFDVGGRPDGMTWAIR